LWCEILVTLQYNLNLNNKTMGNIFTKTKFKYLFLLAVILLLTTSRTFAQGVTSASILGLVTDASNEPAIGATVVAKHEPSGSIYGVVTRDDGRFTIPNVRIGGPYTITVSQIGSESKSMNDIYLSLGQNLNLNIKLSTNDVLLDEVVITGGKNELINSNKTGASTNIDKNAITTMPTLNRSFNDFLRLAPQARSSSVASTAGAGMSFSGMDSRFNNLTIDGSIFNNSFGLASGPGGQANAQPISMDAIDEIQINIAPYDVRQGGFTGAGINAVTKSGTNTIAATAFYNTRNEGLVGRKANSDTANVSVLNFNVKQFGLSLGGPIIKDKLFFFVNFEGERREDPLPFSALRANQTSGGNITRVRASMLDSISNFLKTKYNYDAGEYDNYITPTYSNKAIAKFDYNISNTNKLSLRFNMLRSYREVTASSSGVVSGNRNGNLDALNFRGSNYTINNDIYSVIAELNTMIGSKMANNFQVGFTANRDYRAAYNSTPFPLVDILEGGRTLTSFGYEPFTFDNKLNTNTFQLKDDISIYKGKHTITAGVNFEAFSFENGFKPRYFGIWAYNNLNDFYKSAAGDTNVVVRRVRQTYPLDKTLNDIPLAKTTAYMPGAYIQDEIAMLNDKLHLTVGLRVDVPMFGDNNAYDNTTASTYKFLDENKDTVFYNTKALPKAAPLFSPRIGFNYDVLGNKKLQLRGGTGLFSGRPAFVWISNQIGNNGVIQGEILYNSVKKDLQNRYFTFDKAVNNVRTFDPSTPGNLTYNLAVTDPNFKWPQVWRSNFGVDYKLNNDFIASLDVMYTKNINNVAYINANLPAPIGNFGGADGDTRAIYKTGTNSDRINTLVTDNTVLKNTGDGYTYSITPKIEKQFKNNWSVMLAYNYAVAKDIMTAGSIANSSWTGYSTVNGNNYPTLSFADADQRHRLLMNVNYALQTGSLTGLSLLGNTSFSLFFQTGNQGNVTFGVNGDVNQDKIANNDLMYIPNDFSKVIFDTLTVGTIKFTPQQQRDAFQTYVNDNEYLSTRKGQYTERNGWQLPFYTTMDLSVQQNFNIKVGEKKHTLQVRWDCYNFGNFVNSKWGVANRVQYGNPLSSPRVFKDANGKDQVAYKWQADVTGKTLVTSPIIKSAALSDLWQMQLGVRYSF
jgi:Carboxypeptidase regulatory-like domain/TonB-dependent Receptor Plug Domain